MVKSAVPTMAAMLLICSLSARAQSPDVGYHAETVSPMKADGEVIAAKVSWSCYGTSCTTKAPQALNQAEMCRDLARQVGPLKAYHFGDAGFDAAQLQQCNGANAAGKPQLSLKAPVALAPLKPAVTAPRASSPAAVPASTIRPADLSRLSPMSGVLATATRSSVANFDEYLAASRRYVELPAEQRTAAYVDGVNATFAESIRGAISKAVGEPNIGELLQSVQSGSPPCDPCSAAPERAGGEVASCCSERQFAPPFEGLSREGDNGSRSVVPDVAVSRLAAGVHGFGAAAPHALEGSSLRFTVPETARHARVTVSLDTGWVIGLSGLGYAHVWLGLDMRVTSPTGGVVCSAPHLEQDNQWTWAGGRLTLSDRRPGPSITRTCVLERAPGDPTDYFVSVSAMANGTFVGSSGGYGDYFVRLGPVDVVSCP